MNRMKRYACVHVTKDYLGFYTEPTITEVKDNESLSDVVDRVLTKEWGWNRGQTSMMIGLNKIEGFFVHPSIVKVTAVIESEFNRIIGLLTDTYIREKTELKVRVCEALKEEQ